MIFALLIFPADEVMSMDQRLLKIILENHVLKNKVVLGELYNGQQLETIGGKLLRVFIYRTVCPQMLLLCPAKKKRRNVNLSPKCWFFAFNLWILVTGCVH